MGNAVSNPEIKLTPEMQKIQNLLETNTETFTGQKGSAGFNFGFGQNLGENMNQADILAQLQVALGHQQPRAMTLEEEMAEARRRGFAPPPAAANRMGALEAARAALPEVRVALGHRPDVNAQFREAVGLPPRAGPIPYEEQMAELRRIPIGALAAPANRAALGIFAQTEEQRVAAARARRAAAAVEDDGGGGGGARQADRARIAALERELMQARAAPAPAAAAAAAGNGGNRNRVAAQALPPPPDRVDDNLFEVHGDHVNARYPGAAAIGRYNVNDEVIVTGIIIKLSNQDPYLVERALARVKRIIGPPGEVPFYHIRLNNLRDADAIEARAEPARGAPAGARAEPARGAPAGARAEPARGAPAGARAEPARGAPAGARAEPARGAPAGARAARPFVPRFNVDQHVFVTGAISARENVVRKAGLIIRVIPDADNNQFYYMVRFEDNIRRVAEELIQARPEAAGAPRGAEAAPRGAEAAPRGAEAAPRGAEAALPTCAMCLDDKDVRIMDGENRINVLPCGHTFHVKCIEREIARIDALVDDDHNVQLQCPICRRAFARDNYHPLHLGGGLSGAQAMDEFHREGLEQNANSLAQLQRQRERDNARLGIWSMPSNQANTGTIGVTRPELPESPPLTREQTIAGYEREIENNKSIINKNTNYLNNIKQIEQTHQGNDQGSISEKYRLLAQNQENIGNQFEADRYHHASRTIANNPFNTPNMREFIDTEETDLRLAKARLQQNINDAHANISRFLDYINSY